MQDFPRLGSASQQGSCLWIGDLSTWMDENWLKRIFAPVQSLVSCKVIRHKTTQMSRGYGFLLFNSPEAAHQVLTQLNGTQIPGTDQVFRLNLAANGRQGNAGPTDYSLFVGDLSEEVTDFMLQESFKQYYPSVRSAKVMRVPLSGKSRNFGFCRFASEQERDRALLEMNGQLQICGKPVRVSLASAKKTASGLPALSQPASGEGENTTMFVGGLSDQVTEQELHSTLSLVGELASIKLLPSKGCALVQFRDAASATAAITMLQKQVVAGAPIRINWVRQAAAATRRPLPPQSATNFMPGLGVVPDTAPPAGGGLGRESFPGTPQPGSSLMQGLPGYGQLAGLGPGILPPWGGAAGLHQGGLAAAAPTLQQDAAQWFGGYPGMDENLPRLKGPLQ